MNGIVARFAPSPTGFLHLGGIRTALINYIVVQQSKLKNSKSKLLLRIEDTDKLRSKNKYKESIINGLEWLGFKWDDEILIQSDRVERHKEVAFELLEKGYAFKCICTTKELESKRLENKKNQLSVKRLCTKCENDTKIQILEKNYCIRIKIPNYGQLSITDKIQGKITIENKEIDNFVLLRKDGTPTYMLSVVVDDHEFKINTIIRGDDHLNNTFRQQYIYKYLKWNIPEYAHLPLIHGRDGSKLSKRHGAVDINEFKKLGYLPQSIINNLILLGWSPKKNDEIIEIDQIIKIFEINKMSKSSSIFDYDKLNHFNNHYLRKDENYQYFEKFIKDNNILKSFFDEDHIKIKNIFDAYKKQINFYCELENIAKIYYNNSFKTIVNNILDESFNSILKEFISTLNEISDWNILNLENCIKKFIERKKIKFVIFGKPMRKVLTNLQNGPSISDILYILGKKNTFIRLNNYINSEK